MDAMRNRRRLMSGSAIVAGVMLTAWSFFLALGASNVKLSPQVTKAHISVATADSRNQASIENEESSLGGASDAEGSEMPAPSPAR